MTNFNRIRAWFFKQQSTANAIVQLRFIKFGVVGLLGTLINLGILSLQEYLFATVKNPSLRLNTSLALAISLAVLHNFFWHRHWTWRDRQNNHKAGVFQQFWRYILTSALGITLQFLFTNTLALYMHYLMANLTTIPLIASINYLLNDIWTFGFRHQQRPTTAAVTTELSAAETA